MRRHTLCVMLLGALGCRPDPKPENTDTAAPVDSANPGDSGDSGDTGEAPEGVEAVVGAACPAERRVGLVELEVADSGVQVVGWVFDRPDPRVEAPTEANDTCAFYQQDRGDCTGCPDGQVCTSTGCQTAATRRSDVQLVVTGDGAPQTYDPVSDGYMYGPLDSPGSAYDITLTMGEDTVWVTDLPQPDPMPAVTVTLDADELSPGPLEATWTPYTSTDRVRTLIPMNHHNIEETFTECSAPATSGSFYATAAMVDPLAVVTGLEFQRVAAGQVAAAELADGGCVELRVERQARPDFTYRPD